MKIKIADNAITTCDTNGIRTFACPTCTLFGSKGEKLYENMTDDLFGVSGSWSLRKCPNYACQLIWLDPMPSPEDIPKLYTHYYTHTPGEKTGFGVRLYHSIINHVIEHIPDPVRVLRKCARFLVPSGQLVIVTPNTSSLGQAYFGRDWRGLEPPRHLYLYNPESIRTLVETAGLRVRDIHTVASRAIYFLTLSGLSRKARISGTCGHFETLFSQARKKPLKCLFNQIWESVVLSVDQTRGEEILLVAGKSS